MESQARYPVPAETIHNETIIQRSRFITYLAAAPSIEAAHEFLSEIRALHPDATHHCWAFLVGVPGSSGKVGMSDDGEPHGTAGRPMLQVLSHCGIGDIAAVVVRYYGGTKLGKGGLVRAYAGGVQAALELLPTKLKINFAKARVLLAYHQVDPFKRLLGSYGCQVVQENYSLDAEFILKIPDDQKELFEEALVQLTADLAMLEWL